MNHVVVLSSLLFFLSTSCQSNEHALITHLLHNYSKYTRPVVDKTTPVPVTFGFNLIQIIELKERDQYMICKIWLRLIWKNELLKWKPGAWSNITHFRLPPSFLWFPDIYLQEEIGDSVSEGPQKYKTPIILNSDGTHQWFVPVRIQSNCLIDINLFPFDHQTCKLIFIPWTHDESEIDLKLENKPLVTDIYVNSSEWELLGIESEKLSHVYPCCPNPFAQLRYTLKLERKPLYYIYNLVIPCIVLMIIALFTFFLPAESGERVGVVITVLLVFAVYLKVLSDSLPKTSNSVPALSRFYVTSMVESACSLIATCFVLCVHHYGRKNGPISWWMRYYVCDLVGRALGVVPKSDKLSGLSGTTPTTMDHEGAEDYDDNDEKDVVKNDYVYNVTLAQNDDRKMRTLVEEVQVITSLAQKRVIQDEIEEDWKRLARVIDRVFFIIFLIIFFVSSISTLMPVYLVHH